MSMQSFFERNRTVLISALLAAGAVGSAVYILSSSPKAPDADSSDINTKANSSSSEEKKQGAKGAASTEKSKSADKKKKKNNKKRKEPVTLAHGFRTARVDPQDPKSPVYPLIDDAAMAARGFSDRERKEIADELKNAGNHAFNAKDFTTALKLYSQAIDMWDHDAVYYSNRAAVYGSLQDYEHVVEDTTKALRLQPDYLKCFHRRGIAYERLGQYAEAAVDQTAACILSNFEDMTLGRAVDRVLKLEAERRAEDIPTDSSEWPSSGFFTTYFRSFHKRDLPTEVIEAGENSDDGTWQLKLALDAITRENLESYKQAYSYLQESAKKGLPTPASEALVYEYLATFKFLLNDIPGGLKDINHSLEVHPTVTALIRRASMYIELQEVEKAQEDFERAEKLEPNSADYHYQVAQLGFLQKQWETALRNYERSLELDDSFVLAHIQHAVTKYRMGNTEEAAQLFRALLEKFPDDSSVHNYYGEILLDSNEYDDAISEFDKAIELEKKKHAEHGADIEVLPMLNKALAMVQTFNPTNVERAMALGRAALAIDPASEVAVTTLAQFNLQQGNVREAAELWEKQATLARTRAERIQALTFAEGARTQIRIQANPILRQRLEQASRGQRAM